MSVYFARVRGYVKVGYSADPLTRTQTITRSGIRPDAIEPRDRVDLLGWYPGDRTTERATHAALGAHHVCGEWFDDAPEVETYLRRQAGVDDGLTVPPIDDPIILDLVTGQVAIILKRRADERAFWLNERAAA